MTHPVLKLLHAAYAADAAIEHMQDISSAGTAYTLLGDYAKALLLSAPEHQITLTRIRDDQGRGVPTLSELQSDFHSGYVATYVRIHNAQPAAA